jgi:signal transduction histidine kinase
MGAVNERAGSNWREQLETIGVSAASSKRVLLVDDEPDNLAVLGTLLEDDYDVHQARSGPDALSIVDRVGEPAVVITDQRMPGMSGVELLSELARRTPATVRMVLTAYSDIGPIVAAVNQGSVYRFFLKPWNADEMRSAVADAVWLYQARAALAELVEQLAGRKQELADTLTKLRRSQSELLASERMSTLGRFSAGITHNIRNSLTVMMNLLEIVQQDPNELGVLRAAHRAFQTLEALLRLVSDVNALARGQLHHVNRVPVEMEPFLNDTIGLFRVEPTGKERDIRTAVDPKARVLMLDAARVRQALLALLRNAAEASARTAPIELLVRPPSQGQACLEVRDRGRGFPSGAAEEKGPPRLENDTSRPAAPGVGLEICRVVAEAHGGRLSLASAPGKGTIAQLWLADADPEESLS